MQQVPLLARMSAATCGKYGGRRLAHPGYACRSSLGLIAEALLQQDAVDVHHHPVVELAPLPVFRPQVGLDQLGDLIERELVSRFLRCCGYGSGPGRAAAGGRSLSSANAKAMPRPIPRLDPAPARPSTPTRAPCSTPAARAPTAAPGYGMGSEGDDRARLAPAIRSALLAHQPLHALQAVGKGGSLFAHLQARGSECLGQYPPAPQLHV